MSNCTKPNCDCIDQEVKKRGTEFIKSYPCLAGDCDLDKEKATMSNTKKTPLYDDEGQLNRFPETIKEVEQYETRLEREEGESMLEKHVRNTNENARPYPDHVSGTFMDKRKLPQHILDKMKKNQEDAKNEKAQSADPAILRIEKATEIIKAASELLVRADSTYVSWEGQHFAVQQLILGAMLEFSNTEKAHLESDLAKSQEKCKAYEGALGGIKYDCLCGPASKQSDKVKGILNKVEQALKPKS